MTDVSADDPAHQPLCVPVRDNACGFTLRMFRNRDGARCAVAFTTRERLAAVLGSRQRWVELAEPAVRDIVLPLGVRDLVIDPALIAPPVRSQAAPPVAATAAPQAPSPTVAAPQRVAPYVSRSPRPGGRPQGAGAGAGAGTGVGRLVGVTGNAAALPRP